MHTTESNIHEIVEHQLYRHKQPIFGGFLTISGNRCTLNGIGKQGDGYPEEEGCMSGCNSYSVDDAEMNAAIDEARRRLPELRRALEAEGRRGGPAIKGALVKARFQSPITGLTEHIWLD